MEKTIINENQRGFLFKNVKYVKMLTAGKYYTSKNSEIELAYLDEPINSVNCSLETILSDKAVLENVSVVEVKDRELALRFIKQMLLPDVRRLHLQDLCLIPQS